MGRGPTDVPIAPIYLEHFDEGIIRALGGVRDSIVIDGEEAQFYGSDIPGVCGPETYRGRVPIFFGQGLDVLHPNVLPSITVSRSSIEDDLQRVMPKSVAHKVAAVNSRRVQATLPDGTVIYGPSRKETKEPAWPVNITYNIQIRARLELEFLAMFKWVTSRLHAQDLYSYITVWDSAKNARYYDIFRESMSDIGEYIDVNDVVRGYEFSYRVEGEIDIIRPSVHATVVQPEVTTEMLEG
jgi:hypothetical protein